MRCCYEPRGASGQSDAVGPEAAVAALTLRQADPDAQLADSLAREVSPKPRFLHFCLCLLLYCVSPACADCFPACATF